MGGNSGRKVKSARPTSRPAKPGKRPSVLKSRRSEEKLEKDLTQPAENIRFNWIGPTNKQIDVAQERIRKGESERRVADELFLEVLDANIRYLKDQLEGLTDKPEKRDK